MIKPTVGRVVWVSRPRQVSDAAQPEAALIIYVHSDREINVAGFAQTGEHFVLLNLPLLQDDDPKPEGDFACWMPYQKGQAAKAEAEEAAKVEGLAAEQQAASEKATSPQPPSNGASTSSPPIIPGVGG